MHSALHQCVSLHELLHCPDVDECALGSDCDDHASCQNTDGSYTCTCIHPYSGDGKNCTGNKTLKCWMKPWRVLWVRVYFVLCCVCRQNLLSAITLELQSLVTEMAATFWWVVKLCLVVISATSLSAHLDSAAWIQAGGTVLLRTAGVSF